MSGSASASAIFAESRDAGMLARLDPRARLVAAVLFLLLLVTLDSAAGLAAALVLAVAAVLLTRLPLGATLRRLAAVEGFLIVLLVTLPLTVPGVTSVGVLGLPASREGFALALAIAARVNAGVLVIAALLSTMGTTRLAQAMTGIGVPDTLAHLFQLTVRYIAVFHEEYRRLRRAMRARAFRAGGNWHSWRSLGHLVGMLVVRSVERAERVVVAMKCRGFTGTFPAFETSRLGASDAAFLVGWAGCLVALALVEHLA
jgi:cobalt/nickel transport system permease protein